MLGSEPPPGAGSVMANDERTLPSTIGFSHFSFCAGVPRILQHVHVAVVRRHAVERQRSEQRARRLLVHHRPGDDRQLHAAVFLRRLRRPQPGRPRLLPHRREPRMRDVLVLGKIARIGFERQHVFIDEGARANAEVFDLGREGEIHDEPFVMCCVGWKAACRDPLDRGYPPRRRQHLSAVANDGGAGHVAAGVGDKQQQRAVEIVRPGRSGRPVYRASCGRPRSQIVAVDLGDEQPGAMAFTRTPLKASSSPSAVSWITPALAVA